MRGKWVLVCVTLFLAGWSWAADGDGAVAAGGGNDDPSTTRPTAQSTDAASRADCELTLRQFRGQVELYKFMHGGSYPTASGKPDGAQWQWELLTHLTPSDHGKQVGPFLLAPATNPLSRSSTVVSKPEKGAGWLLDEKGRIFALDQNGIVISGIAPYLPGQGPPVAESEPQATTLLSAVETKSILLPDDLTFTPGGSDEDAATLVAGMLQANQPWINPASAKGTFSLRRTIGTQIETAGPFTIGSGSWIADRVGSMVTTPLHSMAAGKVPYRVRMVGKAKWHDLDLTAVDVTFNSAVRNFIGMGGQNTPQGTTTYSSSEYSADTVRIVIEQSRGIPLMMKSSYAGKGSITWKFDPNFLAVGGGIAPSILEWTDLDPQIFGERQEFQVVNGLWFFKRGDSWRTSENASGRRILRIEMVDLKLGNAE